jgi:hypothetical protein
VKEGRGARLVLDDRDRRLSHRLVAVAALSIAIAVLDFRLRVVLLNRFNDLFLLLEAVWERERVRKVNREEGGKGNAQRKAVEREVVPRTTSLVLRVDAGSHALAVGGVGVVRVSSAAAESTRVALTDVAERVVRGLTGVDAVLEVATGLGDTGDGNCLADVVLACSWRKGREREKGRDEVSSLSKGRKRRRRTHS